MTTVTTTITAVTPKTGSPTLQHVLQQVEMASKPTDAALHRQHLTLTRALQQLSSHIPGRLPTSGRGCGGLVLQQAPTASGLHFWSLVAGLLSSLLPSSARSCMLRGYFPHHDVLLRSATTFLSDVQTDIFDFVQDPVARCNMVLCKTHMSGVRYC